MTAMTTDEFMSYLRSVDVKLNVTGGRLRYSAPPGTLTPALRAELLERKAEILYLLRDACATTGLHAPPILPVSRDRELPLSFAQQRLWFLDRLEPGRDTYHIFPRFSLRGPLNAAALQQSFTHLVRRHEALRTTFVNGEGYPIQVIGAPEPFSLSVVDLQDLPELEQETEA